MSRFYWILGLAAIVICALSLYRSLEHSVRRVAADPSHLLDALRHALNDRGLRRRDDVSIKINGREVALGFSRPGCDGMILVAILPHTAQSWAHMAPRLDLSSFHQGYIYQGAMYPAAPRLERLASRLRDDLRPRQVAGLQQVVAVAETGRCGLTQNAAPALEAVSLGLLSSAGGPGQSSTSTGGVST